MIDNVLPTLGGTCRAGHLIGRALQCSDEISSRAVRKLLGDYQRAHELVHGCSRHDDRDGDDREAFSIAPLVDGDTSGTDSPHLCLPLCEPHGILPLHLLELGAQVLLHWPYAANKRPVELANIGTRDPTGMLT